VPIVARGRRWSGRAVEIEKIQHHVRSNETAENIDEGCEQRFESRRDSGNAMAIRAGDDSVETNTGTAIPVQGRQHRMFGFHGRERSREQRIVSVVADGEAQVVADASAQALHGGGDGRRLPRAGDFTRQEVARHLTRCGSVRVRHTSERAAAIVLEDGFIGIPGVRLWESFMQASAKKRRRQ
jgi:hypothetical protein